MSRWIFLGVLLIAAFVSTPYAARTQLTEVGASIELPQGWVLSHKTGTNEYSWRDTAVLGKRGFLGLIAYDRSSGTETPRQWVAERASALKATLQSDPLSLLMREDSTWASNVFAMYLNYSTTLDSFTYNEHDRFAATTKVGYQLYFFADTLDFSDNYAYYHSLLDSVRFDAGKTVALGGTGARGPKTQGLQIRKRIGGAMDFRAPTDNGKSQVVVTNLHGQELWRATLHGQQPVRWQTLTSSSALVVRWEQNGVVQEQRRILYLP